jgi:YafQ family addiction module toxin component
MSNYRARRSSPFDRDLKKIKADPGLQERLTKKMLEILEDPTHYKPLRNVLKNRRRTHIGSYVLIFEIQEEKKEILFHSFKHHDNSYKG